MDALPFFGPRPSFFVLDTSDYKGETHPRIVPVLVCLILDVVVIDNYLKDA